MGSFTVVSDLTLQFFPVRTFFCPVENRLPFLRPGNRSVFPFAFAQIRIQTCVSLFACDVDWVFGCLDLMVEECRYGGCLDYRGR